MYVVCLSIINFTNLCLSTAITAQQSNYTVPLLNLTDNSDSSGYQTNNNSQIQQTETNQTSQDMNAVTTEPDEQIIYLNQS